MVYLHHIMITLNTQEEKNFNDLVKMCEDIEKDLNTSVNPNEPQEIQNQLEKLRPYLSFSSTMLSNASSIYDFSKGQCADMIMADGKLLNAKANVQKMWVDGKLNRFNTLYVRVERVTKSLQSSIDGLTSLLSFEKEKIKQHIHS